MTLHETDETRTQAPNLDKAVQGCNCATIASIEDIVILQEQVLQIAFEYIY
jgi:hypothetical protein